MKTLTVNVTSGHIARGNRQHARRCPVAIAIREALPAWSLFRKLTVSVAPCTARAGFQVGRLPRPAQNFISNFDARFSVEPFTFTLDMTWGKDD
jgi:hypothetical protein